MVLLDREIPDIDGFAAIPFTRCVDPAVPIVMLTSDSRPGDSRKRRGSGLAGYAVKPVARAVLLRLLCDALDPAGSPEQTTGVFDIVLMDMQMPVMDGFTATRAIRAFEQLHHLAQTPIVAITANALSQDVNESYGAGCNAHVAKPISKQKLIETLNTYRNSTAPATVLESNSIIEPPEGLEEFVRPYLAARKGQIPILLKFLVDSNFEEIRKIAHDLKRTGTSFEFSELSRFGEQLERSAKNASALEVGQQLLQMRDYLGGVRIRTVSIAS